MILPIMTYGNPILRKKGTIIREKNNKVDELIDNMFDTLSNSGGIGLTANQVGEPLLLFIINFNGDSIESESLNEVFINPEIVSYSNEEIYYPESCLSIPELKEEVKRPRTITIRYLDRSFNQKTITYTDVLARIIQHEYDHTLGLLYVDRIPPIKKRLLNGKLQQIIKKKFKVKYPTK